MSISPRVLLGSKVMTSRCGSRSERDEFIFSPTQVPMSSWVQQKIVALLGDTGDEVGFSVAMSGETACVGAPGADNYFGSAYIFVPSSYGWPEQYKITPTSFTGGRFGRSVAISGNTVLVGAQTENTGVVYVFVRSDSIWIEQAILRGDPGQLNDDFGSSVAISGDTALVGAPRHEGPGGKTDAGAAYFFIRSGDTWSDPSMVLAPIGELVSYGLFGLSVAIDGDTALVGAPKDIINGGLSTPTAVVFVRIEDRWSGPGQKLEPGYSPSTSRQYGYSVAISGDTAVVSEPGYDGFDGGANIGAAYIYVRTGSTWSLQKMITATDPEDYDSFGSAVAISGDLVVVGSPGLRDYDAICGKAYEFQRCDNDWIEQPKQMGPTDCLLPGRFGFSVATSGDVSLVGAPEDYGIAPYSGAAYASPRYPCCGPCDD